MRHTAPDEILIRATFDTGARGRSHGAVWISCRRAVRSAVSETREPRHATRIQFGLLEKIMMNEVARLGHTRIVLIEDDLESRESLRMLLEEEGAEVVAVADAEEGAETVIRELPDAVI
jgi:PleD family two-component response regulator